LKNYYQILGLASSADQKTIRKEWLKKAHLFHPDHNPDDPTAEEQFKEIQEAYSILSDPFLRNRYDSGGYSSLISNPSEHIFVNNYFYSRTTVFTIRQYEEFEVTFTYTGRGKVFVKPSFEKIFISGSPYVSHRLVNHEGHQLKETTFTYLVCPLELGKIEISEASIRINNIIFTSEPIVMSVVPNKCHFTENEPADGKPLKLPLHYSLELDHTSEQKKNHTLLIPRSRTASIFHSIGMTMKIVFMIWGGLMSQYFIYVPFLLGCLAGSFLGGINCMIMYRLVGVKAKYTHALKHPLAVEYLEKGYKPGESTGVPLLKSNVFYAIQKLIF